MQCTDKMKSSEFLSNVGEVKTDAKPERAQSYALGNFLENETGMHPGKRKRTFPVKVTYMQIPPALNVPCFLLAHLGRPLDIQQVNNLLII